MFHILYADTALHRGDGVCKSMGDFLTSVLHSSTSFLASDDDPLWTQSAYIVDVSTLSCARVVARTLSCVWSRALHH